MHLNILDEKRIELLNKLNSLEFIKEFCLGGGTSVSLQLGLRNSYDFDFFTPNHFNVEELEQILKENFSNVQVIQKYERKSTLDVYINNIKVSFLEYSHQEIDNSLALEGFNNIKLFSLTDLVAMKCIAIIQRGTKKDFFDLYFLIEYLSLTPEIIIKILKKKFQNEEVLKSFTFGIGFFDDAEEEELPQTYVTYSWEKIKNFFMQLQQKLNKII